MEVSNRNYKTTIFVLLLVSLVSLAPLQAQPQGPSLPPEAQNAFQRGLSEAKQEKWDLAIKCFSQAREAAPESPHVLFNLALAYSKAGGRDLMAIAWFKAFLAAAPNASNAEQVRAQILDLEVKVEATIGKLFRTAKETAARITDDHLKSWAYREIAEAQAKAGDIAGAKETAARIKADSWKYWAYREIDEAQAGIAQAQAWAGDIEGAKETAAGIKDSYDKSVAYREIAKAQAGIAEAQAKAGDVTGASQSFALAKETASRITDDDYKSVAYSEIAKAQVKAGDVTGARQSIALAREVAARITGDYSKSWAYREIAQAQAKAGDIAGAKETTVRITDEKIKPPPYVASTEIKSWTNLAITYQEKPLLVNLGAFVESLKKEPEPSKFDKLLGDSAKGPSRIARALAEAVRDLASALRELRDEEVKWQKLRAQPSE